MNVVAGILLISVFFVGDELVIAEQAVPCSSCDPHADVSTDYENVRLNSSSGSVQIETSIAVNPNQIGNLYVGFMTRGSVNSIGSYTSVDDGVTWTGSDEFPTQVGTGSSDPTVAFDLASAICYMWLDFNLTTNPWYLARSPEGGV